MQKFSTVAYSSDASPPAANITTRARITKPKTILQKKKPLDYTVYYEGEDVTPKPLNPDMFKGGKERQLSVVNISGIETSTTKIDIHGYPSSAGRFKTEMQVTEFAKSFFGNNIDETFFLQSIMTHGTDSDRLLEEGEQEEEKPAEVGIIPDTISLILNETETMFLLDIPSVTEIKDTEEGDIVEAENEEYEYLTAGKGRNRKTLLAEVQTQATLQKTRDTEATRVKTKQHTTSASNWEMYDTYVEVEIAKCTKPPSQRHALEQLHALNETISVESFRQSSEEKQMQDLIKDEKFQEAVTVIERLLSNNTYNLKQKRFKGLIEHDVFGETKDYLYTLDLLWTFANAETAGRCVTSIDWNKSNEDIVAAGYGKFFFTDVTTGMLKIWNIKNPVQPERSYNFPDPVSAVSFSRCHPYLVCVGFVNGIVRVIDIQSRQLKVTHQSARTDISSYEIVNYIAFYDGDEHFNYEEQILACFNGGRVCKYRMTHLAFMTSIQIMRAPESDGKIKGIPKMTVCGIPPIPLTKYTGCVYLKVHPTDPYIYYITTNAGVIHKCSTNYYNQHLDLLLAHDGPIYCMKFSSFCNKLYVTCGADWYIRIWAEGISEPLLELMTIMYPVQYVEWSPTHSTILVSIQGSEIHIWDLQRKTYGPQNVIKSPTNSRNSQCKFTPNGKCLSVTDIDGNIHVFALEDLPIPAFFQDDLLYQTIKKALITKPELLKKFMSLKSLNFEEYVRTTHTSDKKDEET